VWRGCGDAVLFLFPQCVATEERVRWRGDGADGEPCEAETQTRERTGLFGWSQVRATSVTIYIHIYIYIYNGSLPTMSTKLLMSGKYLVTK
jgi:hypothetical protein